MSKAAYLGKDDKARKTRKVYTGVNGVARKVKYGYVGVNGVARKFYSALEPGDLDFFEWRFERCKSFTSSTSGSGSGWNDTTLGTTKSTINAHGAISFTDTAVELRTEGTPGTYATSNYIYGYLYAVTNDGERIPAKELTTQFPQELTFTMRVNGAMHNYGEYYEPYTFFVNSQSQNGSGTFTFTYPAGKRSQLGYVTRGIGSTGYCVARLNGVKVTFGKAAYDLKIVDALPA